MLSLFYEFGSMCTGLLPIKR
uniref:Uncharacterized protein n=1 Tax=Anguilla anguilla TaxID=7936 RepID=A0A0E9RUC0_ANGAN